MCFLLGIHKNKLVQFIFSFIYNVCLLVFLSNIERLYQKIMWKGTTVSFYTLERKREYNHGKMLENFRTQ